MGMGERHLFERLPGRGARPGPVRRFCLPGEHPRPEIEIFRDAQRPLQGIRMTQVMGGGLQLVDPCPGQGDLSGVRGEQTRQNPQKR